MKFIALIGWEKFQHYKDRDPPWIKLHRDLLTSESWVLATDQQRLWLVAMMLMAARHDNRIPVNPTYIQKAAHLDAEPDIQWLIDIGFCAESAEQVATQNEGSAEQTPRMQWASRYVSIQTRAAVLDRDGHKCLMCSAIADLEIDHIVPISQGGTGEISNLQTLCRSCNRRKRTRVADARQTLRRSKPPRSPEAEAEAEQIRGREETEQIRERSVELKLDGGPVDRVFTHWRSEHKHPKASLDPKRRRVIQAALKAHDEATLCASISGYRNSPHHMGENEQRTIYDDIELFLRDAKHIEAGLRFARGPPAPAMSPVEQARQQLREKANGYGRVVSEQAGAGRDSDLGSAPGLLR